MDSNRNGAGTHRTIGSGGQKRADIWCGYWKMLSPGNSRDTLYTPDSSL